MQRLVQAVNLIKQLGTGVCETEILCVIHSHVQVAVPVIAEVVGISTDHAHSFVKHLKNKGLIQEGTALWPKITGANGQFKLRKTWRLTDGVRAHMDHFEATGGAIPKAKKRGAAPAAVRKP